ncbi:MAG: transporter substrate-binding domain-containing protein [Ilumatobacteraceae bacterium]
MRWLLVVGVVGLVGGCGEVREVAENQFEPITPGTLVVAAEVPAIGFWEGTPDAVTGGFEYALAQALAAELDLDLEVAQVPFDAVVAGRLGPADLALQEISVTEPRRRLVDFSVPYLVTAPTVVARRGSGEAAELRDLATARDLTWAVRPGTTQAEFLRAVVRPDDAPLEVATQGDALAAVEDGRVDAALVDLSDALHAAAGSDTLVAAARFDQTQAVAAALPSGSTRNVTAVDQAMRALEADGTIERLIGTWLDTSYATDADQLPVIHTR